MYYYVIGVYIYTYTSIQYIGYIGYIHHFVIKTHYTKPVFYVTDQDDLIGYIPVTSVTLPSIWWEYPLSFASPA